MEKVVPPTSQVTPAGLQCRVQGSAVLGEGLREGWKEGPPTGPHPIDHEGARPWGWGYKHQLHSWHCPLDDWR